MDTWTGRELADEMVKRGIVASISVSQVNRYLAEAELQPHRSKYWLNTTEKDPVLFEQQKKTAMRSCSSKCSSKRKRAKWKSLKRWARMACIAVTAWLGTCR